MSHRVRVRRSLLFTPGDDWRKISKAASLGADCVIMDLEDAVTSANKETARAMVLKALTSGELDFGRSERLVRLNTWDSGLQVDDLAMTAPGLPDGFVLPKVETPVELNYMAEGLDQFENELGLQRGHFRLLGLIETARGIVNLREIASCTGRLDALIFGAEDLAASMGATRTPDGPEVAYARSAVVIHAAAYGLQAIDTPYVALDDLEGLRKEAEASRLMGFSGKLAIHPGQVPVIEATFTPSEEEIAQARRLVEAFRSRQEDGTGVFSFDGQMVDMPMVRRAANVLARARAAGKLKDSE